MILYKTHRDSVELLERENILLLKIWEYGITSEVKSLLEFAFDTMKSKGIKEILFDLTLWPSGFPEGLSDWIYDDFIPRCIYSDLERVAVVVPEDPFSKIEIDNIVNDLSNIFEIKYFKDLEYGKIWLLNNRYFSDFPFSDN